MWKLTVYQGQELILDHSQAEFGKVLKFTMNSLAELMNANIQDFRIEMTNKHGEVYFYAIGPSTQVPYIRKKVG